MLLKKKVIRNFYVFFFTFQKSFEQVLKVLKVLKKVAFTHFLQVCD